MNIAQHIDHTLLKADCSNSQIELLCNEALQYNMAAVCVPPFYVSHAAEILAESLVQVATVIGFPLGYNTTLIKVEECRKAIEDGAHELDVVMNLAAFKNEQYQLVQNEIDSVCTIAHLHNRKVKVIIEAGLWTDKQIVRACNICETAGADFVKTSTGFISGGASVEMIKLMRKNLSPHVLIKASGGIKEKQFALDLINAGAERLGTSAAIQILNQV